MEFTGPAEWSRRHQYELGSMRRVLQIKLREVVREEESGTYGIGVGASISRWPYQRFRITIRFGCDPERVEELVQTVITQIDSLKAFGTTDKYVNKVKENQRRSREVSLKENGFWQNAIQSAYVNGEDLTSILEYDRRVKALTAETIQETAAKYFTMNNYAKFVLYPQEGTEARPPEVE
jgi:zinc protease